MSTSEKLIRFMNVIDEDLWNEIDPIGARDSSAKGLRRRLSLSPKVLDKGITPLEASNEKGKGEKLEYRRNEKRQLLKNTPFSFTSFLIPICITGKKSDYQLLYCMCALKKALKLTSTTLRKEGFAQLYMVGMKSKVDWEQLKSNNVSFSDITSDFLMKSGTVCMIAINDKETLRKDNNPDAPFVVLLSIADVKIPCDAKLCVGFSWVVFRRSAESHRILLDREVFNCGKRTLTAGLCINGCTTTIITAFKMTRGLHRFIFDTRVGEFFMFQENTLIRPKGNVLSLNEGLFAKFTPSIQNWLTEKKNYKGVKNEYYSRYTGGCLTDGYIVLITGGVYLSPKDVEFPEGRRSLLFEGLPLAYLAKKAGALATNGQLPILNVKPERLNQTTCLFLVFADDIKEVMKIV